jgi:hypothetical protein
MSSATDLLPHIDEHSITVAAAPQATWVALGRVIEASFSGGATPRFARLVGCADTTASGPRPLAAGSVLPGFHVASATEPVELSLAGGHRFSDYALIFRFEPAGAGTTLRAETRAAFPGLKGATYRALVIRTRMHVLVTRRLLSATKARAERV